jgi:UDP-glucose 4-epimerase
MNNTKSKKVSSRPLCLVTGGAGFIGSHLVDALVGLGNRVRVLDNLSTGLEPNLGNSISKIELIQGDLREEKDVRRAVEGVNYVFHVAANRAVLRSVDQPLETNEINVTGTLRLLVASRDAGVKRLIFSSSSSVYGDTKKFPCEEDDKPNPQSPYAASKIMGEYYCRIFTSIFGLETVTLRYFNVFGPRQNPESRYSAVIPLFIKCLVNGTRPEVHWDGKQSRDFSYVDNVIHGNILAMKTPGVAGEVFNIACHEEYNLLDILADLKKILKVKEVNPIFKEKRSGDVRRTFADIRKAKKLLGFRVQTRFHEGLRKTAEWFLRTPQKSDLFK